MQTSLTLYILFICKRSTAYIKQTIGRVREVVVLLRELSPSSIWSLAETASLIYWCCWPSAYAHILRLCIDIPIYSAFLPLLRLQIILKAITEDAKVAGGVFERARVPTSRSCPRHDSIPQAPDLSLLVSLLEPSPSSSSLSLVLSRSVVPTSWTSLLNCFDQRATYLPFSLNSSSCVPRSTIWPAFG